MVSIAENMRNFVVENKQKFQLAGNISSDN